MRPLQTEIIEKLGAQPTIVPASNQTLSHFAERLSEADGIEITCFRYLGQDSTLAGKLAQFAVEELREETGMASINLSLCGYHIMNKLMSQTFGSH